jgi:hypothetical protein
MDIKELKVSSEQHSEQNHPWEYARSKVVFHILKKHIPERPAGCALDVGCGDVFFLTRFADRFPGFELLACDTAFDEEVIRQLQAKNARYPIRFLDDIQRIPPRSKATVVFLLDVLEHIEDDVAFLQDLMAQPAIDAQTVFAITVPAFNGLYCKHDQWLGHYRRYSQALLKQRVEAAGLLPLDGGYFFASLLIPRYIQKVIENLRKSQDMGRQGIGGGMKKGFSFSLYEKFLLADFYFFRWLHRRGIRFPGLSTYIICKRRP